MTESLPRELRVFHQLARVVAASSDKGDDVLERICSELRSAFEFERALLVRYDSADETVQAVVQQGFDWPGEGRLPVDRFPLLRRALEAGRAAYVGDARVDEIPATLAGRLGVQSIVAVPLAVEDRCLGFLVLDKAGDAFELEKSDIQLLTTLGCVAAVLIEQADRYSELQHAVEKLRHADGDKSDFLSIASHELRTPISVVHGMASTLYLRGDELDGAQLRDLRQTLFEQTRRLAELASQLLDLSRLEADAVDVEHRRFRPRQRIDELLLRIVPDRIEDCVVEVEPSLEVLTDPDAFERVVSNLVTNALRYGKPPVVIRAENDGRLRLVVQDGGDGVDPAFVPRLFDRFSRSDAVGRTPGGAGLGLSIARSFAEALGGGLTYEQAEPHGARFALELPERAVVAG